MTQVSTDQIRFLSDWGFFTLPTVNQGYRCVWSNRFYLDQEFHQRINHPFRQHTTAYYFKSLFKTCWIEIERTLRWVYLSDAAVGVHRIGHRHKTEQLVIVMVTVESQLSKIMKEEVELSEPWVEWVFYHAGKYGGRFCLRLVWQQGFLDVTDGVGVDSGDSGGCHQCQEVKQSIAVLPHDIESLNKEK